MTRFTRTIFAALISLGSALSVSTSAYAADLPGAYVPGAYVVDSGVCAEPWVLRKITDRFRHQVRNVPHLPNVAIAAFQRIHERRYLPSLGEERPIGRRYCGATVVLSDGYGRDIWYLIEEGMGYASIGDNVEFCVSGFDRWNVYDGHCRVLREAL